LVTKNEDLDLALTPVLGRWQEAEQTSEDQVEDGEQHRGILREHHVCVRARIFDPFKVKPRRE
jgi:hypothetical protein